MFKFIIPTFLIVLSGGLFFSYTDPAYQHMGELREKQAEYNNALTKSKELREVRSELLAKYNSFSATDLDRLEKLVPDSIDNIKLIMEINQMAVKNGGMIRSIEVDSEPNLNKEGDLAPNTNDYEAIDINFTVEASYEDFFGFMEDLGNSLRIVDITNYSLNIGQGGVYKHLLNIRTYWLK